MILTTAFILAWLMVIPELIQKSSDIEEAMDALVASSNPAYQLNITEEFDYIIIGAGSAGAVVANRLSKHGHLNVLVLQDGGDPTPLADIPGFANKVKQPSTAYSYKVVTQVDACLANDGKGCIYLRGKGLGGSSNIYHMRVSRGNPRDYDSWATQTNSSTWAYKNVLKIFKCQEDYHGFYQPPGKFHGTRGESYVSSQQPAIFPQYFFNASKEFGLSLMDANANPRVGYGHLDINVKHGRRWGSYPAFLEPILHRKNLHIYRYAKATELVFSGPKKVGGVKYFRHDSKRIVKAKKEVILCAGTIDSPKLLMLSGIGPRTHLTTQNIKVRQDLPVGQNLQDHISVRMTFQVNKSAIAFIPARDLDSAVVANYFIHGSGPMASPFFNPRAFAYTTSSEFDDKHWPDIEILARGYSNENASDTFIVDVILVRPLSKGYVALASNNSFDDPIIDPNYFSNKSDMYRLIEGVEFVVRLVETTKTFQSINAKLLPDTNISGCEKQKFRSQKYWECFVRQQSSTSSHPVGTVKMGRADDPTSVVDPRLRVLGISGLRVIDSSIMPLIPTGHTHTPALMIGEQGARFILKTLGLP